MRKVNNVMRHHQMQKHYRHITECNDHHGESVDLSNLIKRVTDLEQRSTVNTDCNCSEQLSIITTEIQNINEYISQINVNINEILEQLGNQNTGSVRISPMTAEGLDRLDTTFAKLLGDVENYDADKADAYYADVISNVVRDNSLNDPISLAEIESATLCSALYGDDGDQNVVWDDLTLEQKRAYIKQFILASPSNQTRAAYVTNEILKSIAVVSTDTNQTEPIDRGTDNAAYTLENDPAMIMIENQTVRLRGCPYLMP